LEDVFTTLEEWGDGEYPMIRTPCDSQARKPRDFNLIVVNEYEEPDSFLPWHDDQMNQSVRNEEDEVLTPVITISLGEPAVFAVMPSKSAPQFFTEMCDGWPSRKWSTAKSKIRGRFAFLLHHGDILLMTGKFQKSFIHKTWKRDLLTLPNVEFLKTEASQRNYTFIHFEDDQARLNNEGFKFDRRWVITGRHIHYHDQYPPLETCPLNVLPREQHLGLSADTMMGPGGRDSLPAPQQVIPFKQPPPVPPHAIRFMQGMPFPIHDSLLPPRMKSPPTLKRKPEVVEYIDTMASSRFCDGVESDDEASSPVAVYPDTPSPSEMADMTELVERPLARHTELKYCRCVKHDIPQQSQQ
jgi:hypothetical protein